jgi:type I restriction enzyme, S subunit
MRDLPDSWAWAELADLGDWYGGATPRKGESRFWENGTVPWLSPKDMRSDVLLRTQDKISINALDESPVRLVPEGSVALVVRSGILARTLPVALVPFATSLNQDMKAVVPRAGVDSRWIAWGIRAFERDILRDVRKSGTTVASLEVSRLMRFEIPLPPLAEQQRIVANLEVHLSRVEQCMRNLRRVIETDGAENSKRRIGLMANLVDSIRNSYVWPDDDGRLPDGWAWGTVGDVLADIEAGKSFECEARPAAPDEWGVIKVSAMTWGEFRAEENKALPAARLPDQRYEIRPGDILVSRANTEEYVGAPVLVGNCRPHLLLSDKSLRLKPLPEVNTEWLVNVLASPRARFAISSKATGTKDSMRNISQKSLRSIRIPVPPLQEQKVIADKISNSLFGASGLQQISEDLLEQAKSLREAIMTSAFSGEM